MEKKVKSLFVYPVKSLAGIELENSSLNSMGFPFDRNWMLVDNNHKFLTQRQFPVMALFKPQIEDNELSISYNSESIVVPFQTQGEPIETKVWGKDIVGSEVSGEISQWFSEKLENPVKLLHYSTTRKVDNTPDTEIPFSDSAPFLLINQSSLDDLNSRMSANLSIRRFRPNILISGEEPYAEDHWKELRIGGNQFKVLKKCERCQIPSINQDNGTADHNVLKFLSSYRKDDRNTINFGVLLYLVDGNEINVDDEVEVVA